MPKKLPLFATLGGVLKKSLLELYTSMGFTLLASIIVFVGALPLVMSGLALLGFIGKSSPQLNLKETIPVAVTTMLLIAVWNALVGGPLGVALYGLYESRKTDYPSVRMFWDIFKKNYGRTVGFYLVYWLVVTVLLANILIALAYATPILFISGILSVYLLMFLGMLHFYVQPLIYLGNPFKKIARKAFLLTMDNTGLSFWFFISFAIVPLLFLGLPTIIPFLMIILMLVYGAFVLYVTSYGFDIIYNKYE